MRRIFVIEDEQHSERIGEFSSFVDASVELARLAAASWDQPPNRAPCTSWKTCGRHYEIVEYDSDDRPWTELGRRNALQVSAAGAKWHEAFPAGVVQSSRSAHVIVTIIHMPLVDEGVPVWRPVPAVRVNADTFRVLEVEVPSDERWQFPPTSLVRCSQRQVSDGVALVAEALA